MEYLKATAIRKKWLDFFKNKSHFELPSVSLVPVNDNSLLWVNSGVAALKKYFSGIENPVSKRLVNSQKCIRTNDIENVGVTSRHHTFFEMLGNFSIGDYFKEEAIEFAIEFLTKELELDFNKLYFTVYREDKIAYDKWISLGVKEDHIIKCGKDRCFWDLGVGPCGPCTEIYYDRGSEYDFNNQGIKLFYEDIENDRYVEIWNIVFSEYNNDGNNNYIPLERKNIDTGAGLERLASILQNAPTDYDTDLFLPIIKAIEAKSKTCKYDIKAYFSKNKKQLTINKHFRIIADHFKAATFIIADGVTPSNKERGYILRRLIRRAFLSLKFIGIERNINALIVDQIINSMCDYYPYLVKKKNLISEILYKELSIFRSTFVKSVSRFKKLLIAKKMDEKSLFNLVDTYGFCLDLVDYIKEENYSDFKKILDLETKEINLLKKINFNFALYDSYFETHRNVSKSKNTSVSMEDQKAALINLRVDCEFDYDARTLISKVVALFDSHFNSVEALNNQEGYVVLNKTCFYATLGGQVHDSGTIAGIAIKDVIKAPNGQHLHLVNQANFKIDDEVVCILDYQKRKQIEKNHSAAHLLHSTLKKVIDKNIKQEGAFKSSEKFTLDFFFHRKLTDLELNLVEDKVNELIKKAIPSKVIYTSLEKAREMNALSYFEEKYKQINGDLRVVKFDDYSIELCGGTHVKNTSDIESFMITKLESKGSGSWRIEAITGKETVGNYIISEFEKLLSYVKQCLKKAQEYNLHDQKILSILSKFKTFSHDPFKYYREIIEQKNLLVEEMTKLDIQYHKNKEMLMTSSIKSMFTVNDKPIQFIETDNLETKSINLALLDLINEFDNKIFIILNTTAHKLQYFAATNQNNMQRNLNNLIQDFNKISNGKGGGRFNFAQGGTVFLDKKAEIIKIIKSLDMD